jgi:hypothetical protein
MGDLAIRIVIARWPVKARSPVKESDKNHSEYQLQILISTACWLLFGWLSWFSSAEISSRNQHADLDGGCCPLGTGPDLWAKNPGALGSCSQRAPSAPGEQ